MCITMMVIRLYGTHKIKKLVTEQNTQLQYIEAQYNRACIELRHHHFVELQELVYDLTDDKKEDC